MTGSLRIIDAETGKFDIVTTRADIATATTASGGTGLRALGLLLLSCP